MTADEMASDYVLGTLSHDEREACRRRMAEEPEFAALVEAWERRLAPLGEGECVTPPDGLLAGAEARIARSGAELPGTRTLRAGAGEWVTMSPGLEIRIMNRIDALNRHTFMARLAPGAEYSDHGHDQDEEIFMIEGDLIIGPVVLGPGDFHVARAGRHHPVHRTRSGCLCIISQAMEPA